MSETNKTTRSHSKGLAQRFRHPGSLLGVIAALITIATFLVAPHYRELDKQQHDLHDNKNSAELAQISVKLDSIYLNASENNASLLQFHSSLDSIFAAIEVYKEDTPGIENVLNKANLVDRHLTDLSTTNTHQPSVDTKQAFKAVIDTVFYFEDFANVAEGLLPDSWIGGTHMHVCPDPSNNSRKVLSPFEPGGYSFTVPDVSFPDNWKLTVDLSLNRRGGGCVHSWQIGQLPITLRNTGVKFKSTKKKRTFEIGQPFRMEVYKQGPVFKLYINSQKISTIRVDGFENPNGFTVKDCESGFSIYSIKAEWLP